MNPRVGGACGEIVPDGPLVSVVAAVQSFGRGISNIFHKPPTEVRALPSSSPDKVSRCRAT